MGFKELQNELGTPLTAGQVAELFGVDRRTVRKYSALYGGVWVAPGRLGFFENRIRDIIDANAIPYENGCPVAGCGENGRPCCGDKAVPAGSGRKTRSGAVGTRRQKGVAGRDELSGDPYGFAECLGMGEQVHDLRRNCLLQAKTLDTGEYFFQEFAAP